MNYELIIKEQIEVLKELQKSADYEDAVKISAQIESWMNEAMHLGIKATSVNETAADNINSQIMDNLVCTFEKIKNHENLGIAKLSTLNALCESLGLGLMALDAAK